MYTPRHELGKYGIRRLKRIANFIRYGGQGFEALTRGQNYEFELDPLVEKTDLIHQISICGIFEDLAVRFETSWERLLSEIVICHDLLTGIGGLFGIKVEQPLSRNLQIVLVQRMVNRLSLVYTFPGDPPMARCRKRLNDQRLGTIYNHHLFGRDPLAIAQEIPSFRESIRDPVLRLIFWTIYKPGTGKFRVSMNNLEQVVDASDSCAICLEGIGSSTPGVRLKPCGHCFHPPCVQILIRSIERTVYCPLCRTEVVDFF